jgi:YidC/Oxa1 family membrane protein insertase
MIELLSDLFAPLTGLLGAGLQTLHAWGAPWWLAIVILTVLVRALLSPLTVRQASNVRRLQELRPDMDAIREEHRDDPRKQQEALIGLYETRRVNPLGGCLPALVQLPIFVALYYTIKGFETLQSFTTGGLLWFPDLTAADPYFVLPVLYALTMLAAQEVAMANTAPEQRRLMRLLPIVVAAFLHAFPAGLFVYWVSSNLITLVQNVLIYRGLPPFRVPAGRGSD